MTFQTVTLQLPNTIYKSAKRTAKVVKRPVEEVLLGALSSSLPPLEGLPPATLKELTTLESLDDKSLGAIARKMLPRSRRQKLSRLLEKNQAGGLLERDRQALDKLTEESERLMLRKARALVLMKLRGYAPAVVLQQKRPK